MPIKPLPLPNETEYLKRSDVLELLHVSESQLKRDIATLEVLRPVGWRYQRNCRGICRQSVEILWEYRQIIQIAGRKEAIKSIKMSPIKVEIDR